IVGPVLATNSTSGINANFQNGAQIRRNSSLNVINSVIIGFPVGVYIDNTKGTKTIENVKNGSLVFKNNIIAGCATSWKSESTTGGAVDSTAFMNLKAQNTTLAN